VKVSIAVDAERELNEGARYYAKQANVELGLAFIGEFERSVEVLRSHPELGARWRHESRRMPLRRFPYSIIYLLHPDEIRILAVAHQRRKPGYWGSRQ
jgi:toxin ParE1/3/4